MHKYVNCYSDFCLITGVIFFVNLSNRIDKAAFFATIGVMELEIIRKAGLSEAQAKTYLALVRHGELSPAKIAEITGETRTNTYALLEKLEKTNLVKRGSGKKKVYTAAHPSALETIAEKKRRAAVKNEEMLKASMSSLLDVFYAHSERPEVKTYIGYDGIKDIYRDVLRTGETVYLLRTEKDDKMLDFIETYRHEMGKRQVKTIALAPDTPEGRRNSSDGTDEEVLFDRITMPRDAYTAPVTIMVYGRKIALVAYGEEEMSMIISSKALAESVRQMIIMLREQYRISYPQRHL